MLNREWEVATSQLVSAVNNFSEELYNKDWRITLELIPYGKDTSATVIVWIGHFDNRTFKFANEETRTIRMENVQKPVDLTKVIAMIYTIKEGIHGNGTPPFDDEEINDIINCGETNNIIESYIEQCTEVLEEK